MAETTRIIRPQVCTVNSRVPRQRSNGCFGFRAARSMSIDSSVSTNGASMRHMLARRIPSCMWISADRVLLLTARNARMRRRPDRGAFRHLDLRCALPNHDSKHFQSNPHWKLIDYIRDII